MEPFRPEGVNLPNVMYPGTWVVVGVICTAILGGFFFLLTRWLKSQVPWNALAGYYSAKFYIEPGNTTFSAPRLVTALQKAEALLKAHTRWTADQLYAAFQKIHVYVMKDNAWVDHGQKVAGEDPSGAVVVVGADLAALLHEMAHQVEEKIDHLVDYDHIGWVSRGIRAAEDEYIEWLKTVP